MAATTDDLAAIREHIGSTTPPTDDDLQTLWDRLGTVESVALAVVRGRLADMLARPTRLSVDGDYTEDFSQNLRALQAKERELVDAVISGSSGVVKVARLSRAGRSR